MTHGHIPADDRTADDRLYPAERAYSSPHDTPAWRRIAPDLSGGYVKVHLALDCSELGGIEEVTSS